MFSNGVPIRRRMKRVQLSPHVAFFQSMVHSTRYTSDQVYGNGKHNHHGAVELTTTNGTCIRIIESLLSHRSSHFPASSRVVLVRVLHQIDHDDSNSSVVLSSGHLRNQYVVSIWDLSILRWSNLLIWFSQLSSQWTVIDWNKIMESMNCSLNYPTMPAANHRCNVSDLPYIIYTKVSSNRVLISNNCFTICTLLFPCVLKSIKMLFCFQLRPTLPPPTDKFFSFSTLPSATFACVMKEHLFHKIAITSYICMILILSTFCTTSPTILRCYSGYSSWILSAIR